MESNGAPIIVGLGEILWDLLPDGKQLGGAPANFAYHAMKLGAEAYPASAVGNDVLGEELLERLESLGIDSRHVVTEPRHPTGTVSVLLEQGQPTYVIHTEVAWDYLELTADMLHLARRADAVCFGTLAQRSPLSRETIRGFLEHTSPECIRILDMNLRQDFYDRALIEDSLNAANMLKLNEGELAIISDVLGMSANGNHLLEQLAARYDLRLIAVTRGSEGSRLYTPEAASDHPGYETDVVDTVGAGDAFTAALVVGHLRGHVLDIVNEEANRLASFVCSRKGGTPEYEYDSVTGAINI
jgi:fructokinase